MRVIGKGGLGRPASRGAQYAGHCSATFASAQRSRRARGKPRSLSGLEPHTGLAIQGARGLDSGCWKSSHVRPNGWEAMPHDDAEAAARRLTALLAGLNLVAFPSLVRPAVPYDSPPTADLVSWARCFYASVLLSHVRQLLGTFLAAVRAGQTPGAFVLARCIFELGAHAVLVHETVGKRRAAGDLPGAWENLARAMVGNSEMRARGERTSAGTEWIKPFHVNDGLRALDRFLAKAGDEKPAQEMYDTLTEHAHPSQGAFSQYYRWENSPNGARVVFVPLHED